MLLLSFNELFVSGSDTGLSSGVYRKRDMDEGMEEDFNEKAFEEDTSSTENAKSKIESMIRARKEKVLLTILTIFT